MVLENLPAPGRLEEGPPVLAEGAGGIVRTFFSRLFISLFFLPLSARRPDID